MWEEQRRGLYWGIPFLGTRLEGYRVSECPHFAFTEPCSGGQHTATGLMELELQGDCKPGVLVVWVGDMTSPEQGLWGFPFVGWSSGRFPCPVTWGAPESSASGPKVLCSASCTCKQHCSNLIEMKYLAGSCPLIGRNKLQFYPSDREMVTRIGEEGCCYLLQIYFFFCLQKHFSNMCRFCCFCTVKSRIYQVQNCSLFWGFLNWVLPGCFL